MLGGAPHLLMEIVSGLLWALKLKMVLNGAEFSYFLSKNLKALLFKLQLTMVATF